MTRIKIWKEREKNGLFVSVIIEGHSDYDEKGSDIVCAGISAIVNGTVNFLSKFYTNECQISYSPARIEIKKVKDDPECQLCLKLMIYQLKNISSKYPENLKISYP
jgi:uncharacterized protein YsxB (DUF464 family)